MARMSRWMRVDHTRLDGNTLKATLTIRPWRPSFWLWLWRAADEPWLYKVRVIPFVIFQTHAWQRDGYSRPARLRGGSTRMKQTIINALIRAIRTFFQSAVPVYIAGIAGATDFAGLGNTTLLQAASIAGVIAALSFVMNMLEGATGEPIPRG